MLMKSCNPMTCRFANWGSGFLSSSCGLPVALSIGVLSHTTRPQRAVPHRLTATLASPAWVSQTPVGSSEPVAKALVADVHALPVWTTRTGTLSKPAAALRSLCQKPHDPNQLLFEDLPRAIGDEGNHQGALLARAVDTARLIRPSEWPGSVRHGCRPPGRSARVAGA